jgi:hypothetical protein
VELLARVRAALRLKSELAAARSSAFACSMFHVRSSRRNAPAGHGLQRYAETTF